jgi:MraZ protein
MALVSLFSGHALEPVDSRGGMQLPSFILAALARRSEARRILFSPHEEDRCVTGHDESFATWLFAEEERRRLREESLGLGPAGHHRRARRLFGAAESASFDSNGRILLPEAVRRRAGLAGMALLVGTGGSFEIWNPEIARDNGDETLAALAALQANHESEVQA